MARLEQVHRGNPALPAVVFVHGLGGDLFDTWVAPGTSRDDCWLHWVGNDTGCDTWTLGYDAALSRWQDQAMPLPDQGTQVAQLLAVHDGLKDRTIVLVGHSMGGLVIKSLITQTLASGDARALALVGRIRGVVFVATPHQGSQLASLANATAAVMRTNAQVGDMRLHDAHLLQLNAAFRKQSRDLQLKVAAFAERRDVVWQQKRWLGLITQQVGVRVVDPSSSDPALEGVTCVPLAEDHFSICKPSGRDAQVHRMLIAFLRDDIVAQPFAAAVQPDVPVGPPTVPPQAARVPAHEVPTSRGTHMPTYDIAISFAGEDRPVAEKLALFLVTKGLSIFYDEYEQANLWGKDLYVHLSKIYKDEAKYCLILVSEHYAKKQWTNHERRAAQARAFVESSEYILPLRLDDARVDGILETVGFLDYRKVPEEQIVDSLVRKVYEYNKTRGIKYDIVKVEDVFAKQSIGPKGGRPIKDSDMKTQCPACGVEQLLSEAILSQDDGDTIYTCKNGCQAMVVVGRPGNVAWPGRGYRLGDHVIRNVRDVIVKTEDMRVALLMGARGAALMKKRPAG
jgi:pimeloyl-ACP methyl ester carboxylesterase